MASRFDNSHKFKKQCESIIPLASQTFSKSYLQLPFGESPLFLTRGQGAKVWDIDDNAFTDYISGLLSISLGYADPDVNGAVVQQLQQGVSFSLPHPLEYEVASLLVKHLPSAEMVRFGKNGSDVTSAAIRLARAYTQREHIAICGYHGWHDWYIGTTTRDLGVPTAVKSLSLTFNYNDIDSLKALFEAHPHSIAAVILEPVSFVPPTNDFLASVVALCESEGAICIFDEIITCFRFALGGAQAYFGVTPHLTCLGKGMANGFPLSAIVGRRDIMQMMSEIFFSGTFGGETVALAAAKATIEKMASQQTITQVEQVGQYFIDNFNHKVKSLDRCDCIQLKGYPCWPMLVFTHADPKQNQILRTFYLQSMIEQGILINGGHNFTYAHTQQDIDGLIDAYQQFIQAVNYYLPNDQLEDQLKCPVIQPVFSVRST